MTACVTPAASKSSTREQRAAHPSRSFSLLDGLSLIGTGPAAVIGGQRAAGAYGPYYGPGYGYYGYGPRYYGPAYYGGPYAYYGGPYYRHRYWRHRW
jgi:hypothetical protein